MRLQEASQGIRIVAFVSKKPLEAWNEADTSLSHDTISRVAWGQNEGPRTALCIDEHMDFAVAAAFRIPDRLIISPPLPPLAQR